MMTPLLTRWNELEEKFNALSVRERLMVAGAVAVLLLGLFDQLLLRPWMAERKNLETVESRLQQKTADLSQQLTVLEADLANDPNKVLQTTIKQLQARHQQVDADIEKITEGMIAPEAMAYLLGDLLGEKSGLRVQSMKSSPAKQVLSAEMDNKAEAPAIYRHDLALHLRGSFDQVQTYLESIESMSKTLVWDGLEFDMQQYPKGELKLQVHTLSAREVLIRVAQ